MHKIMLIVHEMVIKLCNLNHINVLWRMWSYKCCYQHTIFLLISASGTYIIALERCLLEFIICKSMFWICHHLDDMVCHANFWERWQCGDQADIDAQDWLFSMGNPTLWTYLGIKLIKMATKKTFSLYFSQ